jgi:hypothetical protein
MSLERDIVERVEHAFSPQDAPKAIELLQVAGKSGRIARCIVFASAGSLDALQRYIQLADQDYRDVIVAGEYDDMQRRLRDLSVSFLIDATVKMWISGIATTLAQRGYILSSVETRPVKSGGTTYLSDLGEGTATFEGDLGVIRVTKDRGQWILSGDKGELEQYNLSKPFDNERKFSDTLSCYILAKRKPNKGAAPNGGPATQRANSNANEGPPSVS